MFEETKKSQNLLKLCIIKRKSSRVESKSVLGSVWIEGNYFIIQKG